MAIANDGNSAVIGQNLYTLAPKIRTKSFAIPKNSKITHTAMNSGSAVAFALVQQNARLQVRVHNWATKESPFYDWSPANTVLNIWGLAFEEEKHLGVGIQLYSEGLDRYAVILIQTNGGNLIESLRTDEWEIAKPTKMAFRSDGNLVVLAIGPGATSTTSSYSIFVYSIPSGTSQVLQAVSFIRQFNSLPSIPPSLTSEGQIFYAGVEKDEGWIMRADLNADDDERIVWCPLSWRSIGNLSLLCSSNGNTRTIVCLNKILGIVAIKVRSQN
jgi:hypothetical protein